MAIVVSEIPDCEFPGAGCIRPMIEALTGHLSLNPPFEHQPIPGELGIEIRLPSGFYSDELLYQLARCLPWLLLGVEAWVPPVWTEGFAE